MKEGTYLSVVAVVRRHGGVAVERVLALDVHRRQRQLQLQVAAAAVAVGDDLHATTPAAGATMMMMMMCHLGRPGCRRRCLSFRSSAANKEEPPSSSSKLYAGSIRIATSRCGGCAVAAVRVQHLAVWFPAAHVAAVSMRCLL